MRMGGCYRVDDAICLESGREKVGMRKARRNATCRQRTRPFLHKGMEMNGVHQDLRQHATAQC